MLPRALGNYDRRLGVAALDLKERPTTVRIRLASRLRLISMMMAPAEPYLTSKLRLDDDLNLLGLRTANKKELNSSGNLD